MNISLEYYKIFYYVAKLKSITNAAKELCISQPAVSQGIKQLEDSLGIQVFVRSSKGVSLTTEGEILFKYISEGYEKIKQGEDIIRGLLELENGEIRIGASDMTLQFYLLPYLERFHRLYPGIKVSITNAPTPRTIDHLHAGRIDFGVVSTPFETGDNINLIAGREIRDIFVAGKQFNELKGKKLSYEILLDYPYIALEGKTSTRSYVDSFLKEKGVIKQPDFELATSAIVVQFAVRNLGIGSVVEDFAFEKIKSEELFKLEFDEELPMRRICVITDAKLPMSNAAKAFVQLLKSDGSK